MEAEETQPWPPIYLAWRQKLAAYWSIAWPSWALVGLFASVLTAVWPADSPEFMFWLAAPLLYFVFLILQAFFVRRLVRKRYRSFRIDVVRDDATAAPRLEMPEVVRVWFRIAWPQAALFVVLAALEFTIENPQLRRALSSLLFWANLPAIGPYSLGYAIRKDYPTFRLLAYGQRFV